MGFLWVFYGFLWFSYGFVWFFYGFSMVSYGFPMVFLWFSYGLSCSSPFKLHQNDSTSHLVSRDAASVAGPDFRLVEVDAFAHLFAWGYDLSRYIHPKTIMYIYIYICVYIYVYIHIYIYILYLFIVHICKYN